MPEMSDRQKSAVRAALRESIGRGRLSRRHPAEVTSDRLAEALEKWPDALDDFADAIGQIRHRLQQIADKEA